MDVAIRQAIRLSQRLIGEERRTAILQWDYPIFQYSDGIVVVGRSDLDPVKSAGQCRLGLSNLEEPLLLHRHDQLESAALNCRLK